MLTATDLTATVTAVAAAASAACAVMSYRWLARARALPDGHETTAPRPELHDAAMQLRYLRALSVVGVTLEAMRGSLVRTDEAPVYGNVVPPVAEMAELRDAATALGRVLDIGILTATVYWLREHWYQRSFVRGSPELHECRARVEGALWETRRLMGIAADTTLPRTLADIEALAELSAATPVAERTRGRRVAARREAHVAMQAASAG